MMKQDSANFETEKTQYDVTSAVVNKQNVWSFCFRLFDVVWY
jgi:hypothetical protein